MSHHDAVLIPAIAASRLPARSATSKQRQIFNADSTSPLGKSSAWLNAISNTTYNYASDGVRLMDSGYVDPTGNFRETFDIYDMTDTVTGIFTIVAKYNTIPVTLQPNFTILGTIHWNTSDNAAPPNKPACGSFSTCPVGPGK